MTSLSLLAPTLTAGVLLSLLSLLSLPVLGRLQLGPLPARDLQHFLSSAQPECSGHGSVAVLLL